MEQSQQKEQNALIPSTLQELKEMLVLCCYNQPRLPHQVLSRADLRASAITAVSIYSLHLQRSSKPCLLLCWDIKPKAKQKEIINNNSTFRLSNMFCSCRKGSAPAVVQALNLT